MTNDASMPNRPPYEQAVGRRPPGACYCYFDDRECYERGHWNVPSSDCNRCNRQVLGPCSREDCGKASPKAIEPERDQWRDLRRREAGACRQADGKCYAARSGNPGWCDRNGCLIGDGLDGCPNDD